MNPNGSKLNSWHGTHNENASPTAADIVRNGLLMMGGGANLKDFDIAVGEYTKHPVVIADEPEFSAIHGAWLSPELDNNV